MRLVIIAAAVAMLMGCVSASPSISKSSWAMSRSMSSCPRASMPVALSCI